MELTGMNVPEVPHPHKNVEVNLLGQLLQTSPVPVDFASYPTLSPWQNVSFGGFPRETVERPKLSFSSSSNPTTIQKPRQTFQFIDQTPQCAETLEQTQARKRRCEFGLEKSIDLDRTRMSQQRRRDKRGQLIRNEVADRLEELEQELKHREIECDSLRQTLNQRDAELEGLRLQFQQIITERAAAAANHGFPPNSPPSETPCGSGSVPGSFPIQTTNRNYVLVPSPNPALPLQGRQPFMEKIDYSKIQLRKTDSSLEEEKKEVISSQEQWEERLRLRSFIRKMEDEGHWPEYQAATYVPRAPNFIYPETLNKIGNLPVSAFTTKVDLSDRRQQLGKRQTDRTLQQLLMEDRSQQAAKDKARIIYPDLMKPYHSPVVWREGPNSQTHSPLPMHQMHQMQMESPQEMPFMMDDSLWNHSPTPQEMDLSSPGFDFDLDLSDCVDSTESQEIRSPSGRGWGGPPSNIYTPPEKIGNLQVPAFTTKVNFSEVPLRKTDANFSSSPPEQ